MSYSIAASALLALALTSTSTECHGEESIPGVSSVYHSITLESGVQLQAIIATGEGAPERLHPLLFTQWVSCGSIEYREGSNARELLAAIARESGLALLRIERDALNGTGPTCNQLDFDSEFNNYYEGFSKLLEHAGIDSSKVYIYGSSLGSVTAPLLGQRLQNDGFDVAGIMVQGGGAVTYLERMLAFDRIYLERRPDAVQPDEIQDQFHHRARFQYEYLINGRHPDQIAKDSESMQQVRNDILGMSETDHYGRPFAWHQQIAQRNTLAAWAAVDAPVLVVFNEFDQFETRHGHELIVNTVNRLRPGSGTFIERPSIGHSDNRYPTILDAYAFENGEPAWQESAELMLRWLRSIL